jgi:6,7-dimethyl-8-ribityllumazine synthase
MAKTHEGMLRSDGKRFAIVASRFNDSIGNKLVEGALDAIRRTGGSVDDVEIFRCRGRGEVRRRDLHRRRDSGRHSSF